MFNALQTLPAEKQRRLLLDFFTKGVKDFPNAKILANFLVEINNLPWLQPQRETELGLDELADLTAGFYRRANLKRVPVELIKDKNKFEDGRITLVSDQPWDAFRKAIQEAAETNGRDVARRVAWDMAWNILPIISSPVIDRSTARIMALSASWITVYDLMREGELKGVSPLTPLIEIFSLGYFPIGEIATNGENARFAIFDPRSQKSAPSQS